MVITTSSDEAGHTPLEIVQRKVFAPAGSPEILVVASDALANVAEPVITVQSPMPIAGEFPCKVEVVEQIVWSCPAAAIVGVA